MAMRTSAPGAAAGLGRDHAATVAGRARRCGVLGAARGPTDEQHHQPAEQRLELAGGVLVDGPWAPDGIGDVVALVVAHEVDRAPTRPDPGEPGDQRLVGVARAHLFAAPHQLLERERALDVGAIGDDGLPHVVAGHADDKRRRPRRLGVEGAAHVAGDVDGLIGHHRDRFGGWRRASGQQSRGADLGIDTCPLGQVAEQALGHRGPALIGRADEEDVDGWSVEAAPTHRCPGGDLVRRGGSHLCLTRRSSSVVPTLVSTGGQMAVGNHLDPRTPVIVGVGQWNNRVDRGETPVEPADMMAEALRRAGADSGAGDRVLRGADAVRVVSLFSRRYRNAARLVAERIGASPRDEAVSPMGGNEPQALVSRACLDIAGGDADTVLVCGAEAWRTRTRTARDELGWTTQDESVPPARLTGPEVALAHPGETARDVYMPAQVYPLFEQALRHAAGRSVEEHLTHLGELWAGFNAVAVANPHAWIREPMTAGQIRTPAADNRWICWPYTKVMNANNAVEQSAALIVCSAERAEALGVPRDRWVFPLAGTQAHDTYAVSHRPDLASSGAIRVAARQLLSLAGRGVDEVAHVDLYSCFPSAVQIAAEELGLGLDRPLTVTGGLSFAGGPWNNYVTHAIATMLPLLRDDPSAWGLCTANGGYLTKHALGVYAARPPARGFRWESVQEEVDALPARDLAEGWSG